LRSVGGGGYRFSLKIELDFPLRAFASCFAKRRKDEVLTMKLNQYSAVK